MRADAAATSHTPHNGSACDLKLVFLVSRLVGAPPQYGVLVGADLHLGRPYLQVAVIGT